MGAIKKMTGVRGRKILRTVALRLMALIVAIWGIRASFDRGLGSKLTMRHSFDYWDFNESTSGFFITYLFIMGLYVCLGHYLLKITKIVAGITFQRGIKSS
jgi:hypothetical protein